MILIGEDLIYLAARSIGFCEHPESPAPPSGKSGLAQENFRPIAPGTGNCFINRMRFLLVDFAPIAKSFDQREGSNRRELKFGGVRFPSDAKYHRARRNHSHSKCGTRSRPRDKGVQPAKGMSMSQCIDKFGGARERGVAATCVR